MDALEVLTASDWNAGPLRYDFLCRVEFKKDGTGKMKFGGGQVLRLEVNFRYRVIDDKRVRFEFFDTESKFFSNASFKRTDLNIFRCVEFEIRQGSFSINEPYLGEKSYQYVLRFNLSPFPIDTDVERGLVEFYGWRQEV